MHMKTLAAALILASTALPTIARADTIEDPLHGFCIGPPACSDNGVNTPIFSNPPVNFGFTVSPKEQTGILYLDILVPNTSPVNPANTVTVTGATIAGGSVNFTLHSTTAWTGGQLDTYLGLTGSSPANPIGAYLPSTQTLVPTATGFFVLEANLGTQALNGPSGPFTPTFSLNRGALGMYIVGFLDTPDAGIIATANSGALFEKTSGNTINPTAAAVPGPIAGAGIPGVIAAGLFMVGLAKRRRNRIIA